MNDLNEDVVFRIGKEQLKAIEKWKKGLRKPKTVGVYWRAIRISILPN